MSGGQAAEWAAAPIDAALAVHEGWTSYASSALARGRLTPLAFLEDAAEWWRASTVRTSPTWASPYRVVRTWPQARLLDFSASGADSAPALILPPQAGHASTIVDYSPEQSQVRTAMAAGLTRAYALDWLAATAATSSSTVEDYVAILDDAIATIGGPVHLVGDCQGGWLAAIYAALRPANVRSIALGGAPIDCHAGDSAIQEWVRRVAGGGSMTPYRALVSLGGGNHLGINQIRGFKMLEPAQETVRLAGLWGNIHDPAYVRRFVDFTTWFEWGQDIPGAFYLWIVEHLFQRNELHRGVLVVGGEVVDLGRIAVPVFLLAGTRDHITPSAQMFALADLVSTAASDVHTHLVDAGHLGLFMGHEALAGPWAEIFTALAEMS